MATINKGILGGLSGQIGNVVGSNWNGIDTLRTLPAPSSTPATDAQIAQRYKFTTVLNFLKPLTQIVRIGYAAYADRMTAFNAAFSNTIRFAVSGISPNYTIDYPNVLLTRGNLENATNASAVSAAPAKVTLTWDPAVIGYLAKTDDSVLAVVYSPVKQQAVYSLNQATRADGTLIIDVPAMFTGDTVEVYLSFSSASAVYKTPDRNTLSNSLYTGNVVVQ